LCNLEPRGFIKILSVFMAKPALLTIDDDPDVRRAVERDLRKHYSEKYRVLAADSALAGLDLLRRVQHRNEAVALLLVDYRMPQTNGIEFLMEALKIAPDAKRVLLTAYADTDAAIRAINDIKLNHYLLKPWDPPETHLYPVLDDLLGDWQSNFRPPFEGMRVLGTRWSPRSYDLREFLARNRVPYRWLDAETADKDPEVRRILASLSTEKPRLPMVFFTDGEQLSEPTPAQIADRVGLRRKADTGFYDLAIVGGGPAGLAAGVYGASEGLRTVVVEREAPGGQAGLSSKIENYLGFPSGLSGRDLARRAVDQASKFGVQILAPQEAASISLDNASRTLKLSDGSELSFRALVLSMGVQWRKLNVPGMDRLQGAGVYYGAGSTEASACSGEDVYIVGGANSAGQAAINFSNCARRVIMLVRGNSLAATMSKYLIDDIAKIPNIQVEFGMRVVAVDGKEHLETVSIQCATTNIVETVPATSLFIFIGAEPRTDWLDGFIKRDTRGFILTGRDLMEDGKPPRGWPLDREPGLLETSVPGIFAVGDVRHGSVKRVASGVGEGSIAIQFVHQYLNEV
jgi:thioredoxin reductase (NADPH)